MMNERSFLQRKYREKGYDKISEFCRGINSEISQETWGAILNRGDKVNLRTLLKMCVELGCSKEEVTALLIARGESLIAKWIEPAEFTLEEREIIDMLREIRDEEQKKLVKALVKQLVGK